MGPLLLFALISTTSVDDLPKGWGRLSSPAEGFDVIIPDGFTRQKVTDKDMHGDEVKVTFIRGQHEGVTYIVGISEFGEKYMKQTAKKIFDNARDGSVSRSKGKLVVERPIKAGKLEGREFITAAGKKDGFVRARVFIDNGRQYSAMVAGKTQTEVESEAAKRFLGSFRTVAIKKPK